MRIELELTDKQFQEISKGLLEYQKRIISLAEYSRLTGANPANLRQKIARGTLKAKKIENKWYIER